MTRTAPWVYLMLAACFVSDEELRLAADRDGDGFHPSELGGPDCDNEDPNVNPNAKEVCGDGVDNDCNGVIDDDGPGAPTWYLDEDGDGWGVESETTTGCSQPSGYTADPGDCDPDDPSINPAVEDLCDGFDQDCDGVIDDDAEVLTWYRDADTDGIGTEDESIEACSQPVGYVPTPGDCEDDNTDVQQYTWYADSDLDGYGDPDSTTEACAAPSGFVGDATDCDDLQAQVNPAAIEVCADGIDNNCDGGSAPCGPLGMALLMGGGGR